MSAPTLKIHDGGYGRGEVSLPVHCLPSLAHVAILAEYQPLDVRFDEHEGLWFVFTKERRYTIGDDTGALLAIEYWTDEEGWVSYSAAYLRDAFLRRPNGPTPHLTSISEVEHPVLGTQYVWHCTCGRSEENARLTFERAEAFAQRHREAFA